MSARTVVWGGDGRKLHVITPDDEPLCGRVGRIWMPIPKPDFDPANGTHTCCKRCLKLSGTTPVIIVEVGWSLTR
jgi:hypothetical protein